MTSSTTEPQIQAHLSEDLYFMKKMSPSRLYQRGGYSPPEARLLDIVALFLATGPSNPTIATFWWERGAKLYIAKSPFDHQNDATDIKTFFLHLTQAQSFSNMIPFLATHSQATVNKRICKLRQSLWIGLKLFSGPREKEDPLNYLESTVLDLEPPFVFDGTQNAISTFEKLVMASRKMLSIHRHVFFMRRQEPSACYLQRHLDKMAQYLHVEALIKFWKRKKHGRGIEIVVVPGIETGDAPHTFNMETILNRHLAVIPRRFLSSPEELRSQVTRRFRSYSLSITITPHVHAEIVLILHVSEKIELQHLKDSAELLIGSNKTSCFACMCWRKHFNSVFHTTWETTCTYSQIAFFSMTWKMMSVNNVPRFHWAIPCTSSTIDSSVLSGCSEAVLAGVQGEVKLLVESELDRADDILN